MMYWEVMIIPSPDRFGEDSSVDYQSKPGWFREGKNRCQMVVVLL